MEERGVGLPLVEAFVRYLGRARYDDLLRLRTSVCLEGRACLRFEVDITQARDGKPVARGHTIHAVTGAKGKPMRPPEWLLEKLT
jgi:acyl-CoA thioester hydrolase